MFFFNIIFLNIFILKKFDVVDKKECVNLATIEHSQGRCFAFFF